MKLQRWWLPIIPTFLLVVLCVDYPSLYHSIQSLSRENFKSSPPDPAFSQSQAQPAGAPELTPEAQIYRQIKPAVVTVYGASGLGSGMIVRSQGLVLTNKHVVGNVETVKVQMATGELLEGRVVDFDLRYDLALIKLSNPPTNLPTVTLAEAARLKAGDRVYAIGSPGGHAGTLTTGTFSGLTDHGSLQTSIGLLNPGNSGGPLINTQGRVIGVNKGLLEDKSGLATPIAAVITLLKRYDTIHQSALASPQTGHPR